MRTLSLLILVCTLSNLFAQTPNTLLIDGTHLVQVKKKLQQKDPATLQLVDALVKKADALLNMKPVSVVDKGLTPPSGNKHDYMSQAPYFWYDSSKPNGCLTYEGMGSTIPRSKKSQIILISIILKTPLRLYP